jgi:DNA-binding NtrC family response regulator
LSYQEAKAGVLHEFEIKYFTKLLHHYKGNVNQAAIVAGMYRPNLLNKLKQLNIEPNAFRRRAGRDARVD